MKIKTKAGILRFPMNLLYYGNSYYIDRIAALEQALTKKPRQLQIDLLGEGEIAAEWALLIREILGQRSPRTRLITNARSTLKNGSVLVWLLGDQRLIRPEVRLFFRETTVSEAKEGAAKVWNEDDWKSSDAESDPDEAAYVQVLQLINEYLPVKEMAGKVIDVATLGQFGLVNNDAFDRFLADAFGKSKAKAEKRVDAPKKLRGKLKVTGSTQVQK